MSFAVSRDDLLNTYYAGKPPIAEVVTASIVQPTETPQQPTIPPCHLHTKPSNTCKFCRQYKEHKQSLEKASREAKPDVVTAPIQQYVNNTSTCNLPEILYNNIKKCEYFQALKDITEVEEVIEQITHQVKHLDPYVSVTHRVPSTAFCCLLKLLQLGLNSRTVHHYFEHRNIFVKCLVALYCRFHMMPTQMWETLYVYLLDTQEVELSNEERITFGEFLERLLLDDRFLTVVLPRMPSKIKNNIGVFLMSLPKYRSNKIENIKNSHLFKKGERCKAFLYEEYVEGTISSVHINFSDSTVKVKVMLISNEEVIVDIGMIELVEDSKEIFRAPRDERGKRIEETGKWRGEVRSGDDRRSAEAQGDERRRDELGDRRGARDGVRGEGDRGGYDTMERRGDDRLERKGDERGDRRGDDRGERRGDDRGERRDGWEERRGEKRKYDYGGDDNRGRDYSGGKRPYEDRRGFDQDKRDDRRAHEQERGIEQEQRSYDNRRGGYNNSRGGYQDKKKLYDDRRRGDERRGDDKGRYEKRREERRNDDWHGDEKRGEDWKGEGRRGDDRGERRVFYDDKKKNLSYGESDKEKYLTQYREREQEKHAAQSRQDYAKRPATFKNSLMSVGDIQSMKRRSPSPRKRGDDRGHYRR